MTTIATITAETLPAMTWQKARVITTELLARLYGTETDNIRKNFSNNADKFVEGTHFIKLEGEALRDFKNCVNNTHAVPKHARNLTLWTERGAARHAKMLDTEAAWEVFERLEDCYFRTQDAMRSFVKNAGDVLTIEQADLLRNAMTAHRAHLPKHQQGPFLKKGWSKLKSHFKVGYRQIPQEQLTEALSMITRHAIEWEVVDELPALPEASGKPVDVRGLMLSGHSTPTVKLPAEVADELEQTAWRMAGEAFHLSKEYLQRRVAYLCEWNQPREVNAAKAMDVLKTSTLGFALTHHCYDEMAHAESFVRIAQEKIDELMSEIGKFKN